MCIFSCSTGCKTTNGGGDERGEAFWLLITDAYRTLVAKKIIGFGLQLKCNASRVV